MKPRHLKARVDWKDLKAWCLYHGAKNECITDIRINGAGDGWFSVVLEGHELNEEGKPFTENRHDVARWRTVEPLRYLP